LAPQRVQLWYGIGSRAIHRKKCLLQGLKTKKRGRRASSERPLLKETAMLHYAIVFLVIALIAAVLGFGGIAGAAAGIAKILFLVFLVLFIVSLFLGRRTPPV
jgi:uncharacterized membrane protein YtjA (UPF0391 family)